MKSYPDLFTTGEAAKLCRLSQQTIIRCFDMGQIKGSYKVPNSRFRRIPRAALEKFMRDNEIPMDLIAPENLADENGKTAQ